MGPVVAAPFVHNHRAGAFDGFVEECRRRVVAQKERHRSFFVGRTGVCAAAGIERAKACPRLGVGIGEEEWVVHVIGRAARAAGGVAAEVDVVLQVNGVARCRTSVVDVWRNVVFSADAMGAVRHVLLGFETCCDSGVCQGFVAAHCVVDILIFARQRRRSRRGLPTDDGTPASCSNKSC